jgi:YD repeat-containing protein
LQNFIADAPNSLEMLARYRRNDILDERDEISPVKLAMANPDCRVHIYDVHHVSTNKDTDKVPNCKYEQYHNSEVPVVKAEGVTTRVQGTSSASYGLAAFNIDADFKNTQFTDANGEPLKYSWDTEGKYTGKYALNENSIPCNYFTTKVNVASSENANNALN